MKFAMQDARTLELLNNATKSTWKLVAFFFHDRGSEIQRSLDGMMQELLRSILQQHPSLLGVVTPLYLELVKSQRAKAPKWDTLTLHTALLKIAQVRNPSVRLCLFLDALDEHSGDNDKLAVLLKDMVRNTDSGTVRIKVCLASRSWAVFTKHFGNCPGFAIHEHTVEDISSYTRSRLTPDSLGSQHLLNPNQLAMITAQITKKSSGVFIWVRLVIDQLSKDIQDGTPFGDLEDRVMEMPPELEDLYRHALKRIEVAYGDESYMMLQMAYCSISPLSLQAFMECTSYNLEYSIGLPFGPVSEGVTEGTSLDTQLRRLASRTGGLLEAISNPAGPTSEERCLDWQQRGYHVQFIHQTVREYVGKYRHNLGLAQVSNHVQRRNGYYFLLSPTAGADGDKQWLQPLKSHLFIHAKRLEASIDPSDHSNYCAVLRHAAYRLQEPIINSCFATAPLPWLEYIKKFHLHLRYRHDRLFSAVAVFNVLAIAANLVLYINSEQTLLFPNYLKNFPIAKEKVILRALLHVAVAGPDLLEPENVDHCAMVESLVKLGWPVDMLVSPLSADLEIEDQQDSSVYRYYNAMSPLAYLLICKDGSRRSEDRRLQIAKTLLKLGANVDERICLRVYVESVRISLLEYCVRYGTAPFVRLLLQHGASQLSATEYTFRDLAFLRGDRDIIQALNDHGVPFGPFALKESSDLETVPQALTNIFRQLPLILPHGQAM